MDAITNDKFQQLSYNELRGECRKAHISARGNTQALRKRLRELASSQTRHDNENSESQNGNGNDNDNDNDNPPNKRQKKSPADDLVCPITLQLPWEPVTAEDGRVYEKEAIEIHIKRHHGGVLKSPMTNEVMGKRLLPAPQIRSLIETLIENGAIQGDLASTWNDKVKQVKEMESLLQRANNGDVNAMVSVARRYKQGISGCKKNPVLSYTWYKKAHDAGSVKATAMLGIALCLGKGVEKCTQQGIMYISLAAGQGSDYAAFEMGHILLVGKYGIPVNKEEGIRWLQKALSKCKVSHLSSNYRPRIQAIIDELLNSDVVEISD